MKRYKVTVKEIWEKVYFVDADDSNDAAERVHNATWDAEGEFEYSGTLKDETKVEEEEAG